MTRRLFLAAAGALAAVSVVFAAPPAQAAAPSITIASPLNNALLTEPVMHIQGEARMGSGGTVTGELRVDVESLDGHGTQGIGTNVNGNPVPFNWDYTPAYNGRYRVTVTARGRDGAIDPSPSEVATRWVEVSVEVKPVAPTGLTLKTQSREVVASWKPNPEPDIVMYQVQRRHEDDESWVAAGNTTATTLTDKATAERGGEYEYRVVAVRNSATPGSGLPSDPSGAKSIDVPNPPGTTTTTAGGSTGSTVPGGGGGSGGGGGGSTGGGGGGSGGGGGGSTGGGSAIATTGKVDLSGFADLLESSRTPGAGQARPGGRPGEEDGGFGKTLPFKEGEAEELGEDGTALAVGVDEAGEEGAGRKPIAFVAASLLVTVILMHVLWLKREVETGLVLPAEDPA